MTRRSFGTPILAAICAVVLVGLATPASAVLPTYSNDFEADVAGWFPSSGTISRQASGYTNPGGYADGINSASGGFHARLDRGECFTEVGGGGDTVRCSGPFTRWGGYNSTWTGGYTTQVDIYLDAAYAQANADSYGGNITCLEATDPSLDATCKGTRFDFTSAINDSSGNFLRDFGFNVSTGLDGDTCDGFTITGQTNVNRTGANPNAGGHDPQCIDVDGWYTFRHTFSEVNGYLNVLMEIIPVGSATAAASWTITGIDPIDTVGCNRYGWFSNQEIYGLPIDNASMTGCGTPPTPVGKISPTGTTCQQYADGTAPVLGQLLYTTNGTTINAVSPGVFFYYTKVSGVSGQTVGITEANGEGAPPIPIQNGQVVLYNASTCKVVKWTVTANADGTATGTLPSSGDFIIGVKYNASALKGKTAPASPPVTYSFGTTLNDVAIPADTATIDLVRK